MGEGAIPITAILRYAAHYGMDREEEQDLVFFIRQLDNCYLKHQNEKMKKK